MLLINDLFYVSLTEREAQHRLRTVRITRWNTPAIKYTNPKSCRVLLFPLILLDASASSECTRPNFSPSPSVPKVFFPQMIPAIITTGLTRRFGDFTAVDDVNLTVASGQFFGFLGPNGAGKSTTIKMLTGLLAPTSGSIQLLGLDAATHPMEVKRQIGVVPEGLALFGRLTASEYLRFVGRMYGLDAATTAARTEELLDFMSLANETKKLITDFSHGMQKKLALAAAVIHGPKVLFLDEPFEGVDAIASGTLKAMLQGMIARGATIFLTSHVLEIVERLCSHIAIIDRGHLIANGSLEELRAGVNARNPDNTSTQTLTLEQIFLSIVGGESGTQQPEQELSWLG
jgi:ABC-2 type transport system ATP-binding protein